MQLSNFTILQSVLTSEHRYDMNFIQFYSSNFYRKKEILAVIKALWEEAQVIIIFPITSPELIKDITKVDLNCVMLLHFRVSFQRLIK